jgi:hypothetical protein
MSRHMFKLAHRKESRHKPKAKARAKVQVEEMVKMQKDGQIGHCDMISED